MHSAKIVKVVAAMLLAGALTACESSEERAEGHYQRALQLIEAGDVDRALVELRNVFQLNGQHLEARRAYADAQLARGEVRDAYSQYLRLIEQYPNDQKGRIALIKLAVDQNQWDEVERQLAPALEQQPDNPDLLLVKVTDEYRKFVNDQGQGDLEAIRAQAEALKPKVSGSTLAQKLLADSYVRSGQFDRALQEVDEALAIDPDDLELYQLRLSLLDRLGDTDAVEQQLLAMVERFPKDTNVQATLLRWYIARGETDQAERFMRARAASAEGEGPDLELVQFLARFRSSEAALQEVDALIAGGDSSDLFRSVRAGLRFELGARDEAIAEVEEILKEAEPSEQTRNIKIALARMLLQTGNEVGSRAMVEEVLAEDPTQVEALKLRSAWLIDDDETDQAILNLRTALDQSPRDADVMTLLARAYDRAGNRELSGEMLALAVEASNNAPEESLRYAQYLIQQDKVGSAESVLIEALRVKPNDMALLRTLGALYARQKDWPRATQVADTLSRMDGTAAQLAAGALRAEILGGQNRVGEVVGLLQDLVEEGQAGSGAKVAIVKTYVENGDVAAAEAYLETAMTETPDDPSLKFAKGALDELKGEAAAAEEAYRQIVADHPNAVNVWRALYSLQARDGRVDAAEQTLEEGLTANPGAYELLWAKASTFQQRGRVEEAIEIYEDLYARNSSSPVMANNLASLLSTYRSDPESIERAYEIARRLQNVEVPAFQDTFGWLAHLRGDGDLALQHLEPAAAALANDPSVQYHLGMAYAAAGRTADAVDQFKKAIALRDIAPLSPEIGKAADELERLRVQQE